MSGYHARSLFADKAMLASTNAPQRHVWGHRNAVPLYYERLKYRKILGLQEHFTINRTRSESSIIQRTTVFIFIFPHCTYGYSKHQPENETVVNALQTQLIMWACTRFEVADHCNHGQPLTNKQVHVGLKIIGQPQPTYRVSYTTHTTNQQMQLNCK